MSLARTALPIAHAFFCALLSATFTFLIDSPPSFTRWALCAAERRHQQKDLLEVLEDPHARGLGLIRFGRQVRYATNRTRAALSNSAGLT
jgi:hypothetical protein